MPNRNGKKYIVVARYDFTGWAEARALANADSETIAKFIWEEVICRRGIPKVLVTDGGPENKKACDLLLLRYGIQHIVTAAYNPPAAGMIERGHDPIINALSKMTEGGETDWPRMLHLVLLADRTSVKRTTGRAPFELVYGEQCILPIEAKVGSWRTLPWDSVQTTEDLLTIRAEQLNRRDIDLEEAAARLRRSREEYADYAEDAQRATDRVYGVGDLVLLFNSRYENDYSKSRKLAFWWLGPYRIKSADTSKGSYQLEDLDGSPLSSRTPGRRLKLFKARDSSESSNRPRIGGNRVDSDFAGQPGEINFGPENREFHHHIEDSRPQINTDDADDASERTEATQGSVEDLLPAPIEDFVPEDHIPSGWPLAVVLPPA
jgi:hypothetical protein